jgi:hypothetical protein
VKKLALLVVPLLVMLMLAPLISSPGSLPPPWSAPSTVVRTRR